MMRVHLLVCGVVCSMFFPNAIEGVHPRGHHQTSQQRVAVPIFTIREVQDDGGPVCGNKAVQLSATSAEKKAAMELVQQFRQTSFSGKELPSNQESKKFKNKKNLVRIDLQNTFYNPETKKRWMNFQIQLNQQRSKGGPTTIAHLFLEANRTYPIEAIRQGFNESLAKCAKVWLEFSPQSVPEDFKFRKPGKK